MTLPETASSRWSATEELPFPLGPARIEEEDACNLPGRAVVVLIRNQDQGNRSEN